MVERHYTEATEEYLNSILGRSSENISLFYVSTPNVISINGEKSAWNISVIPEVVYLPFKFKNDYILITPT